MGVSGCGKSTVGQRLAQALAIDYLEGDDFHPPSNVERMAQGIALTDADRQGWLATLAARLREAQVQGRGVVLTCSALKRSYRDLMRTAAPGLRLVYLHGDPALIAARMAKRQGHYMPASLLASQLADLEPPGDDEQAIALDATQPIDTLIASALSRLGGAPRTELNHDRAP
jgi:carbohydrate kinase (thermoresistant glucokinase family)